MKEKVKKAVEWAEANPVKAAAVVVGVLAVVVLLGFFGV